MKTTYQIREAHSGTSSQEIEKAKKLFRQAKKDGKVYGQHDHIVEIVFSDVNNKIKASFSNSQGESITDPVLISQS